MASKIIKENFSINLVKSWIKEKNQKLSLSFIKARLFDDQFDRLLECDILKSKRKLKTISSVGINHHVFSNVLSTNLLVTIPFRDKESYIGDFEGDRVRLETYNTDDDAICLELLELYILTGAVSKSYLHNRFKLRDDTGRAAYFGITINEYKNKKLLGLCDYSNHRVYDIKPFTRALERRGQVEKGFTFNYKGKLRYLSQHDAIKSQAEFISEGILPSEDRFSMLMAFKETRLSWEQIQEESQSYKNEIHQDEQASIAFKRKQEKASRCIGRYFTYEFGESASIEHRVMSHGQPTISIRLK